MKNNQTHVAEFLVNDISSMNPNPEIKTTEQVNSAAKIITYKKPQIVIDFDKVAEAEAWSKELRSRMVS